MKRTILFGLLIVGLLLVGTHAFSWSGGPGMRGCQDGQRTSQSMSNEHRQERQQGQQQKMAIILDLSEEQQQQLQNLREQHRQQQQVLRTKMQASREQLREVASANETDEAGIRAAVQEHAELKTRMMVEGAKHRQQIAALLTPEQQLKFEQLRELKDDNFCGKRGQSSNCGGAEKSRCRGDQDQRI
ncbi:MAG: Spy/CpxP family protein refolding chaperone [Desulfuromonadales bacterium]|nr:Spy/CpxP family protein refolding chaperone [Desulfuromonadales bacterium]